MNHKSFSIIMSMMNGWSEKDIFKICKPYSNFIDFHCPLIFKNFKSNGYVTAYGEDLNEASTFYNGKKGFKWEVADYNLLPALAKAYKNMTRRNTCLGNRHEFEYVLNYALEFSVKYINHPNFAFFRIGSLTEKTARLIDEGVFNFLTAAKIGNMFANMVVFIASDQESKSKNAPKYEELLPIMYVRLPEIIEKKFPEFVRNLEINKNRLINPYDIYMTFKHILELPNPLINPPISRGCPDCKSIFQEIPKNRSCSSIGIEKELCPCVVLDEKQELNSELVFEIALKVLDYINLEIDQYILHNQQFVNICKHNELKEIVKVTYNRKGYWYRIILTTYPANSKIEAIVNNRDMTIKNVTGKVLC